MGESQQLAEQKQGHFGDRPTTDDLERALETMSEFARRQGADAFDILAGESESTGVEVFEQKIKSTEISSSRGIGIRLFRNGRPGYSFTERLTPEALELAVTDAIGHTELTDPLPLELPREKIADQDLGTYSSELESVAFDDLKALALKLESTARGLDPQIENVPYAGSSISQGRSLLLNSHGVFVATRGNSMSAYVAAVAHKDDVRKMGVYANGGRSLGLPVLGAEYMAGRAVERAVEMLGAAPVAAGDYPTVFSNQVSGRIVSMFSSPFFADVVQKGQSRLAGKRGEKIASDLLSIRDEPHRFGAPGSRRVDSEGVATRAMDVVENGILKNFLYNLEAAAIDGVSPTGHGARGYSGKAGTGFSNLIVVPGKSSLAEMLSAHDRCLLVTKLEGGAGCSSISGEISIGMQGFLYEKGQRIQPVDRMTISGNWFDLLNRIVGLSGEYSDSFSSVRVPDMLVEKIYVGA